MHTAHVNMTAILHAGVGLIVALVSVQGVAQEKTHEAGEDGVMVKIVSLAPLVYTDTRESPSKRAIAAFYDESSLLGPVEAQSANPRLYPNGEGTVTWPVQVTDQNGRPVPGVTVTFSVSAVRPTGDNWRSADGVVARFGTGSRARVRREIDAGTIRLLGTMRQANVVTNASGIAEGIYQVSHIGGNQSDLAREQVIASISSGQLSLNIDIGYDWLTEIPTVNAGLRIQGATGTHTHRDLADRMRALGEAVRDAGWPHPVTITAGTLRWGGLYPPHFSHRWGAEFDMRPMTTNGQPGTWRDANYDRERTQRLVNALNEALGASVIYFNDPMIDGATQLPGHDDHLHVSFAARGFRATSARGRVHDHIQ